MPGGGYRAMFGQIEPLGPDGARSVRGYVEGGGMYIGCCARSYDAATVADSFVALCPAQPKCACPRRPSGTTTARSGDCAPRGSVLRRDRRGDHPVMSGMPPSFEIAHYNGRSSAGRLRWRASPGAPSGSAPWEEMLGERPQRTLVDDAASEGVANIVADHRGDGRVVLFGSHPEFGFTIAMEDEQQPSLMLLNAVEWQLAESGAPERPEASSTATSTPGTRLTPIPPRVTELSARLRDRTARIRERGDEGSLARPYAMSFFGLTGREIWAQSLGDRSPLLRSRAPGITHRATRPLVPPARRLEPRWRPPRGGRAARAVGRVTRPDARDVGLRPGRAG